MNFSIKSVPKWAWIGSGAVVVGTIGYRVIRRNKSASTTTTADGTTVPDATANADYQGTADYSGLYGGGGSGSFIVPAVNVGGTGNGYDVPPAQDIGSILDAIGAIVQPRDSTPDILNALTPYLTGGGVPSGGGTTGVVQVPAPTTQPPAPANNTPVTNSTGCPAKYPFRNSKGCYQVIPCVNRTEGGKPIHYRANAYSDGNKEFFNKAPGAC